MGDEVLTGETVNTNFSYMSHCLRRHLQGLPVSERIDFEKT